MLLLGRDLTIRRFSPQAEKQFDLLATDVGRPISHIRHNLVLADDPETPLDLEDVCVEVITSVREKEREVLDKAGRWHSLRVRPYTTLDKQVDGAVLLLLEIDELKQSEQAVAAARDYAENIVETVREPLLVLDSRPARRTMPIAPSTAFPASRPPRRSASSSTTWGTSSGTSRACASCWRKSCRRAPASKSSRSSTTSSNWAAAPCCSTPGPF